MDEQSALYSHIARTDHEYRRHLVTARHCSRSCRAYEKTQGAVKSLVRLG